MKLRHLTFLLIFISTYASSQKLGFSSLSPFGGQNKASNHTLLHNTGEVLVNKVELNELDVNNGLLQSIAQNKFLSSFIQVQFYHDNNENGIKDSDDLYLELGAFTIENNDNFINYSKEGIVISAPQGNYKILYNDLGAEGWLLTTPSSFDIEIDSNTPQEFIEFGLTPDVTFSKLEPYLSSGNFRCNSPRDYTLTVKNNGFTEDEKIVWLKMDSRIPHLNYAIQPDHVIDSNYVGWNVKLLATETTEFNFSLQVPGISNDIMVGEWFKSSAWIEQDPETIEFCYEQELRCSYDPNDKLVNPNRPDSLALLDQPITYTIRFQNTGNDYAEDVVVTDTLSEHLDMSTFKIINTSHPNELEVQNDKDNPRIINFRFDNIYLLDSMTNEEASNGHVMYTIRPNEDLPIGTVINNTGHIYFDFNPAIVTNTTGTTLVDAFPIISTSTVNEEFIVEAFPNPTTGEIKLDKRVEHIKLYDLQGRMVTRYDDIQKIDLSRLDAGTYLLESELNGFKSSEKIVLVK